MVIIGANCVPAVATMASLLAAIRLARRAATRRWAAITTATTARIRPVTICAYNRYFFRVFALDVERLDVPKRFTAGDVFRAMHGHVLAEAATYGTYSLNSATEG